MKQELISILTEILQSTWMINNVTPLVNRPENVSYGHYTSNVALQLSKPLKRSPMEIALEIKTQLELRKTAVSSQKIDQNHINQYQNESQEVKEVRALQGIAGIDVLPPGFINIRLSDEYLVSQTLQKRTSESFIGTDKKKKIMVEYAHPNTHKAFHIGHLRNIATGESIVRFLEARGHEVIRANYQGDVGMHIAKALYALLEISEYRDQISGIRNEKIEKRVEFLGNAYAAGSKQYEENEEAKKSISEINKKIYAKDPEIYPIYQETRQWSLDYFETIYARVGTHYDRYYYEGEVYEAGRQNVLQGLKKGIFLESDGAIIFPGEKFGLHNRVFITSEGNPTYEGKDMGLGPVQFKEYNPDLIVHVVGPEQAGYFQVVFEALAQLYPETRGKEFHLIYGWVRLKEGKMSSRSGKVVLGSWLLDEAKKEVKKILEKSTASHTAEEAEEISEKAAVAAVKYAFLRVSTQQEIAFDFSQSVSFDGDSGPYLQYTYARCKSVLKKTAGPPQNSGKKYTLEVNGSGTYVEASELLHELNTEEQAIVRLLLYFPEIVEEAADQYAPNVLCTYLFQLAQSYNVFYAKHEILGNQLRIQITDATAGIIKQGLYLLGIETLERM